jgi:hypothetical protein
MFVVLGFLLVGVCGDLHIHSADDLEIPYSTGNGTTPLRPASLPAKTRSDLRLGDRAEGVLRAGRRESFVNLNVGVGPTNGAQVASAPDGEVSIGIMYGSTSQDDRWPANPSPERIEIERDDKRLMFNDAKGESQRWACGARLLYDQEGHSPRSMVIRPNRVANHGSFFGFRWMIPMGMWRRYWGYRVFQLKRGRALLDGEAIQDPENLQLESDKWSIDSLREDRNKCDPIRTGAWSGSVRDMVSIEFRGMKALRMKIEDYAVDLEVELVTIVTLVKGSEDRIGLPVAVIEWAARLKKQGAEAEWIETGIRGPGFNGTPVLRQPTREDLTDLEDALDRADKVRASLSEEEDAPSEDR